MKKLAVALFCLTPFLSGCMPYGDGQYQGYATFVSDGLFWTRVGTKTALESSEENCFAFRDGGLRTKLEEAVRDRRPVTLRYKKHLMLLSACGPAEVTDVTVQ